VLSQRLTHPNDCRVCESGLRRVRLLLRMKFRRSFPVKTWCRICGTPALIEVSADYEQALRYAYRLDESVMVHQNHEEQGGWGVHWRMDEVLDLIFPQEHVGDIWTPAPWYTNRAAEDQLVVIASEDDQCVDERRRHLIEEINAFPKTRRELESLGHEVWDRKELDSDFEVLGFRAPFVVVENLVNGMRGSLLYQEDPRFYYGFEKDRIL